MSGVHKHPTISFRVSDREREMIEAKIAGQEFVSPSPAPQGGKVVDLMEALQASVKLAQSKKMDPGKKKKTGAGKQAKTGT